MKPLKQSELARSTTLALFDQDAPTKIMADASAYGLGAVLHQHHDEAWKPVAYASKSMTETEHRNSQIGKEALALVWACEKFEDYVLGKKIQLETDQVVRNSNCSFMSIPSSSSSN